MLYVNYFNHYYQSATAFSSFSDPELNHTIWMQECFLGAMHYFGGK